MNLKRAIILVVLSGLAACASEDKRGRISELDTVSVELKDINVEGGLDKAMQGYQKFLEQTPESELTPEAIRRLADLKVEKEYGVVTDGEITDQEDTGSSTPAAKAPAATASPAETTSEEAPDGQAAAKPKVKTNPIADVSESEKDFEKRATSQQEIKSSENSKIATPGGAPGADLQNSGAEEAITLYNKLLEKYPMYEKNDQVLYQLSRAYEETGRVDEAMGVMNRLVKQFPNSRYTDEVQFRRGEYYFTRKKYLDAEEAYGEVLKFGVGSVYYERALFKKGWTFYKQELYEDALHQFIALLDYKVNIGYDFEQTADKIEKKRIDDTFRVISLSFSNLGGAATVEEYFKTNGSRSYEDSVYSNLAEFYFSKRRYSDAAVTYNTFVENNPIHKVAPHFSMRVIEIYMKGGFPRLVIEAKKQFASTYGIHADYWNYFDQKEYPKVLGYLKTNITDLANHYHSLYQNKKFVKQKAENFREASHWYREFLNSFPQDEQSPGINYQLADLLLENRDFNLAAMEYERTAYEYPVNEKSPKAAYAAVYAYREHLKTVPTVQQHPVKRDIIRSSIRLVDNFPKHDKATVVLGAAVDDLFNMQDYEEAIKNGRRLIQEYPNAEHDIRRGAWLVVAHSSYEIENFSDAETAYIQVLDLTPKNDKSREKLIDNLAASIYKQGEQAKAKEEYKTAVKHFLRIADLAPTSKIRPSAEYDAAAVLIQIMELEQAETVLLAFRKNYPGHKLQKEVTKKIAYVYKELGKFTLAAKEYERIAAESEEEDLIRDAMLTAAELYEKAKDSQNALRVYKQFVAKFPKPLEFALETHYKIAMIYKSLDDISNYRKTLLHIITSDARAGDERTDRTRYLAAQSSLVILEPSYEEYIAIKLVNPLKKSLTKKQKSMKKLVNSYTRLVDYKVADVTSASTYYIAEIYYNFSRSLMESERPKGLSDLELEEFVLALEDQAFPFEEKAISVHEKNVELLTIGVYSTWIDRSIEKLATLLPARYAKYEERIAYIDSVNTYRYSSPRFIREDAKPLVIEKIDFFRYSSQKQDKLSYENSPKAETSIKGLPKDQGIDQGIESQQVLEKNLPEDSGSEGSGAEASSAVGDSSTDSTVEGSLPAEGSSPAEGSISAEGSSPTEGSSKDNGPDAPTQDDQASGPADTQAAESVPQSQPPAAAADSQQDVGISKETEAGPVESDAPADTPTDANPVESSVSGDVQTDASAEPMMDAAEQTPTESGQDSAEPSLVSEAVPETEAGQQENMVDSATARGNTETDSETVNAGEENSETDTQK